MKRIRVTKACEGCRARRTKCDGESPICQACENRGEECRYNPAPSKRKPPSKRYVEALEARVTSLEEHILKLTATPEMGSNLDTPGDHQTHSNFSEFLGYESVPALNMPTQHQKRASDQDVDELEEMLGSFSLDNSGELRFFGACSNFHLIQDKSAFGDPCSTIARAEGIKAAEHTLGLLHTSDELREHLLSLFWRWQNSWQYVVPREIFLRHLHSGKHTRYCSPLLISAILALASRYSDRVEVRTEPTNPNTAGAGYAARAKIMLNHEAASPTVSTVQAAALLGLYYTGANQEGLGWTYSGMAVRMAYILGLNLDCSSYVGHGIISQDDLECRNVAWWGVFVLDNLYTVGEGRPSTTRDQDITAGYPSLDGDAPILAPDSTTKVSCVSTTAIHTCKLLRLARILDLLYAVNPTWDNAEKKRQVLQTHLGLVSFYDNLPTKLKITPSVTEALSPQVYVLHLQFHVTMILVHRQFARIVGPCSSSVAPEEKVHAQACRWSAEKICSLLQDFRKHHGLRYSPISVPHCALTAAVVYLAESIHADAPARAKAKHQLRICIRAMEEMSITWAWGGRCLRSLQSLAKEWNIDWVDLRGPIESEQTSSFSMNELHASTAEFSYEDSQTSGELNLSDLIHPDVIQGWLLDESEHNALQVSASDKSREIEAVSQNYQTG